jgi:hypothetical protein
MDVVKKMDSAFAAATDGAMKAKVVSSRPSMARASISKPPSKNLETKKTSFLSNSLSNKENGENTMTSFVSSTAKIVHRAAPKSGKYHMCVFLCPVHYLC